MRGSCFRSQAVPAKKQIEISTQSRNFSGGFKIVAIQQRKHRPRYTRRGAQRLIGGTLQVGDADPILPRVRNGLHVFHYIRSHYIGSLN